MKITYKILWLDDKIEELFIEDEYVQDLFMYISQQGFNPILETVSTEDEFFKKLDDSFDLILTDYHLKEKSGETRDGDLIVKAVRDNSIFTEILFYSAKADLKDTFKLDRITFVETFKKTATHQQALIASVKQLVDLTIKKFQHIVAMRGMIMHETSSLDALMLEIIKLALDDTSINFDDLAVNIYDQLLSLFDNKTRIVQDCKDKNKFKQLTKDSFVFSADYKIQTLSEILKNLKLDDFSEDYKEKINSVRNKFAHAVLMKDVNGKEYFKHGSSGIEFNEELCKQIREDIIRHNINLQELHARLKK